ncbi:MAG TPA: YggS family pyridoxal phosphate-dependent enzyme [Solirubrobacteraceae bacterium]|nr:YggS family pyridoxal phosphate-dependent enzyme [Solirubrobacteraceae bacterium]
MSANLATVREQIAAAAERAGRSGGEVVIVAAVKYLPVAELGTLADAGLTTLGENRAQELVAKAAAWPGRFEWHFIGHLQSRKVKQLVGHARVIHSVSSDSALAQLAHHVDPAREVLIEVNLSGEQSKSGVSPQQLDALLERSSVRVSGLMTMPPLAEDPEASRPYFARLRELAERHGLARLSMGTSQDFAVAVEEGATLVRIGTRLYS